ncbi:MAG: hypothetical protein AMXMBFR84_46990 [Candidatus Hydrogenedentota bacterium]
MRKNAHQLVSYIAPAAPATRRPATGDEPYLRPEIGFTPKWYRDALGIDFNEQWHADPSYRRESILAMRAEIRSRFPHTAIGSIDRPDSPLDLLTGAYGACTIAAIYGLPIRFHSDNWPVAEIVPLTDDELERLQPPNLESNPFFLSLLDQMDWIERKEGCINGFINWQGVLNNAHRLRGEQLFLDLLMDPERCRHLFQCVATTMIDAAKIVHARQRATGVSVHFFTVSNCLVNLVSPDLYETLLLPFDKQISGAFEGIGIHNCAWTVDPYLGHYASVPGVSYMDMGLESDFETARALFPEARRAVMYRPTELAGKSEADLMADMERIARELGPCDLVMADIESGTPDARVQWVVDTCRRISERMA